MTHIKMLKVRQKYDFQLHLPSSCASLGIPHTNTHTHRITHEVPESGKNASTGLIELMLVLQLRLTPKLWWTSNLPSSLTWRDLICIIGP